MKTTLALPDAVRSMVKYDMSHYRDAEKVIIQNAKKPEEDEFVRRCRKIVSYLDEIYDASDVITARLIDLVFIRRDRISVEAAADILEIGKTQAYTLINRVLIDFAIKMGYVTRRQLTQKQKKVS